MPAAVTGKNHPAKQESSGGIKQRIIGGGIGITDVKNQQDNDEINDIIEQYLPHIQLRSSLMNSRMPPSGESDGSPSRVISRP